jgi:hypothetical protein
MIDLSSEVIKRIDSDTHSEHIEQNTKIICFRFVEYIEFIAGKLHVQIPKKKFGQTIIDQAREILPFARQINMSLMDNNASIADKQMEIRNEWEKIIENLSLMLGITSNDTQDFEMTYDDGPGDEGSIAELDTDLEELNDLMLRPEIREIPFYISDIQYLIDTISELQRIYKWMPLPEGLKMGTQIVHTIIGMGRMTIRDYYVDYKRKPISQEMLFSQALKMLQELEMGMHLDDYGHTFVINNEDELIPLPTPHELRNRADGRPQLLLYELRIRLTIMYFLRENKLAPIPSVDNDELFKLLLQVPERISIWKNPKEAVQQLKNQRKGTAYPFKYTLQEIFQKIDMQGELSSVIHPPEKGFELTFSR